VENLLSLREVVAVCIESPLYFTMPVRERLELVKKHAGRISFLFLRHQYGASPALKITSL
jgi:hypothetical protein